MNANILPVLIYFFENFLLNTKPQDLPSGDAIGAELKSAGFEVDDILHAIGWVGAFRDSPIHFPHEGIAPSIRFYSKDETEKLDITTRVLLNTLERDDIINAKTREIIIDRAMALNTVKVDIDDFKWIMLFALFFHHETRLQIQRFENTIMLDNGSSTVH